MGDMGDDFAAMKAHRQQQHADWKKANLEILSASGAIFTVTNYGETLLFRMSGYPRADFYPGTGRWRVVGSNSKAMSGGVERFLDWYRRQQKEHE